MHVLKAQDDHTTVKVQRTPPFVILLTLLSTIGGFLFGYDTGVVSGATLPIADKFKLNTFEKELFVSITGKLFNSSRYLNCLIHLFEVLIVKWLAQF